MEFFHPFLIVVWDFLFKFVANNYKLNEFPAMSRKFNTKKFIKDVLNDKYALVIGNGFILDTKIEPTGDVHQYFLRKVNEN